MAEMYQVFRVADLISKTVSARSSGGFGSVGLVGPDQDPDDFSPLTPYIMVWKHADKLRYLDRVDVSALDIEALDDIALDIGRAVVAGKFFPGSGAALCSQDMPTCARNERISPYASMAESITNFDLGIMRSQLELSIARIDRLGKQFG